MRDRGYCGLRGMLSTDEITCLRDQCDELRDAVSIETLCDDDCALEPLRNGLQQDGSSMRTCMKAYLDARIGTDRDPARRIMNNLLAHKCAAVAAAALGCESPRVFNEHFVVKPAKHAGPFQWHTDAAHQLEMHYSLCPPGLNATHEDPDHYVSFWCALDDITPENGALVLLPLDVPQPAQWHQAADAETIGQLDSSVSLVTTAGLQAGDAVIFSSRMWHYSASNVSPQDRRVYYVQYSCRPIGTGTPLALALHTCPDVGRFGDLDCIAQVLPNLDDSHVRLAQSEGALDFQFDTLSEKLDKSNERKKAAGGKRECEEAGTSMPSAQLKRQRPIR